MSAELSGSCHVVSELDSSRSAPLGESRGSSGGSSRTKTLFRYPGGKHYAVKMLSSFLSLAPHEEYREPFVGGGSVFFSKPKSLVNVLNDADRELITTYKVIQHPVLRDRLLKLIEGEVASRERWREVLETQPTDEVGIAFKYFYLNRTSFSGKLISPAWGYRERRSLPPSRWKERIVPCGHKLESVDLRCADFEEVIGMASRKATLLFVDPPYFNPPKRKHYRFGMSGEDHERLASNLANTRHRFILTYDDVDEVRALYDWAFIHPVSFFYRVDNAAVAAGVRRLGFELVITNFRTGLPTDG